MIPMCTSSQTTIAFPSHVIPRLNDSLRQRLVPYVGRVDGLTPQTSLLVVDLGALATLAGWRSKASPPKGPPAGPFILLSSPRA